VTATAGLTRRQFQASSGQVQTRTKTETKTAGKRRANFDWEKGLFKKIFGGRARA
jgi:hypothetical protein